MRDKEEFTKEFIQGFLVCALWSSTLDDGTSMDQDYSEDDLATATKESLENDCKAFVENNFNLMETLDAPLCGHNFWMSRCRHGSGFWDEGWGATGDRLHEAAIVFGNVDLYVGDDGMIYR